MKSVRHFLTTNDFSAREVRKIFDLAREVKARPNLFQSRLGGKTIGLIFEKPSTRTWVSFQVGMTQLGGSSIYFGPEDISLGKREAIKDVARVLSRYLDAMALRTFSHARIEEFARYSERPVINGLSDFSHPCQALTDLYTMEEKLGSLKGRKIAYVGDGNNVCNSLMVLSAKMGVTFAYASPKPFLPSAKVVSNAKVLAKKSGVDIIKCERPQDALKGADVVYTDVWISMGQEKERLTKIKAFAGYQVNAKLLKHAKKDVLIMHCLPAHRGEEIMDEVLESEKSIVFDQAENRLHVQKAILLQLIES